MIINGLLFASQGEEPVRLAVDGLALVYHVMRSPGEHELHLELG